MSGSTQTSVDAISECRLVQEYIERQCGIRIDDNKMYLIKTRLTALMIESGCSNFTELLVKEVDDRTHTLRDKIIDAMTINETFWFRDQSPFVVLRTRILEKMFGEIREGRRQSIRIWSAACSTGQEPFSIAMTVREFARTHPGFSESHVEIQASDISRTVLMLARTGRYDSFAMGRGLPPELRDRYFSHDKRVWQINGDISSMVKFSKINLLEDFSGLGKQDIVFCRNVLMYFRDDLKSEVLTRLGELLNPGGCMFLGATESFFYTEWQKNQGQKMVRGQDGVFYKIFEGVVQ